MTAVQHASTGGKRMSFYFTDALDAQLEKLAQEQNRSKSQVLRLLVEQALSVAALMKM